ncbi:hypothetical protein [Pseudomonas sp. zfem002]|uniref:hypothetical protein n=1 Tax=Pseudomonas sp. zfem002 TaxID=3078197 RepID=UPI002927CDC3|nr:hypothetical protein [Pseudomonas sp. zfem002]MDU9391626.1 hypothetical protein [Pseudomonas sp. zfem002]
MSAGWLRAGIYRVVQRRSAGCEQDPGNSKAQPVLNQYLRAANVSRETGKRVAYAIFQVK